MRAASCTLGCLLAVLMPAVVISFYAQPKAVQFVESPGHVTSCQGCGPIVLQCSIAAQSTVANVPRPLLQWVVNETDLVSEVFSDASVQLLTDTDSATSQLTLPTPHTGHNGRYGCVARDGSDPTFCDAVPCVTATTLSNTATVQILADNVSVETVVYSGDCERAALLSCGVQGDFPTVWFRDRDVIQPNNQTEYLLPNGDLLVHHHGNSSHVYSCMGELQTTNATLSQYELHTVTPVTTLTPHTTVQVHNSLPILLTGDASTLVCTYERQNSSCDQPSMPRWYHNGREMNAAELVHAGHVIRLERVGVADAGVYCCVVEGVESCTTLDIVERTNPDSSTRFIGSTDTTLHIPAPLHMPHPLLRWFHNGLEIKSHQGLSALNQTSEVTSALYGLYQLFIEQLDGTLTELTLTRSLPYGVSNPPGRPTLTELPRYNTAAARVEWTPPLYTGGVADPWFNIRHRGLSISHTLIRGKSSVIDLLEFNQNSVSVGVASDDGTELSEWGVATSLFLYTALCGDHDHVRAPPELSLSCVDGSVSIALTHTVLPARLYRAGDCMKNNQTLHVPLQPNVLLLSVAVGTQCGFEAAAAPASYPEGCATGERCQCFYPYNLEYTLPVFCNVTGTVQFNQSEYTVDEGTSEVQICLTAQGYDFSVIIETEAATATASDDYTPQIREFEFTADTLTHCLNVSVRDDVLVEGAETFRVTMTTDNPLVVIPTPSATVNIMDNDLVGVSFIQNSSLFLPFDTTTFEVCVFLEGQLEREVRVNLTSSIDDGAEASEMHFNSSRAIVCVNNTRNSTDGHLLLMLVTSDPQVRVSETGLSVYILQEQITSTVQFNQSEYTVDEGTSEVQICLTAQGYDFSVIIETEAATATASDDYTPQIREFEFTADTLTHCLNVSVRDDVLVEGAETFRVTMTTDNPLVVIPTPSATVNIMDNDLVGVSFIQNSSLFLPFDTTTFEVCVFLEGQLEREVRVNLTSSIDDGAEASEMQFNSSRAIVCVNNTRNSTDGHLLLMLVTSDPQVRVSETGLSVYILQEQITSKSTSTDYTSTTPTTDSELVTMTMVGVVTVTALVFLMLIVVLCTCIAWKRYKRKRYEKQIRRFGINKSEKFCSDFEDPVSVGPCVPVSADPDDITLYNEFFPGGSAHCSALSLDKAGGEFPLETGVTSEEILEHLERYTNSSSRYQQDSGIGEYLEQPVNCDFGSGFSGQSFSSYVHCKQYNCMCGACLASRAEGKSPTSLGKSPTNVGKSPPETVGCEDVFVFVTTLSTSLPELSSCDNNVNTSLSSSNCADT